MVNVPVSSSHSVAIPVPPRGGFWLWCRRLGVLAGHTFTQLVRMKVLYFLLVFSLVLFVVGFVWSSVTPDAELKLVKDTSFGVMQIFGLLFGVVSVALLLPKDMEDRTLYTILTKPVRRYEYLLGKYLGVLGVLFLSLLIMDVLSSAVLQVKYHYAHADGLETIHQMEASGKVSPEQVEESKAEMEQQLAKQGLRWDVHLAVVAIFLKISVITAVAMAISTFAGSTIFTMLAALCIYVIGHLQAGARESLMAPEPDHGAMHAEAAGEHPPAPLPPSVLMRLASGTVAVIFPDFQVYNVVDAVVAGKDLKAGALGKMFGLSAVYLAVYLGIAIFMFAEKEL
jgi:ABC-type transport system involved in cytochrome c biogenesis permease component